tara:strand:+ start:302 stop:520 length:219 start_codon:yes stop_codon:yes gene_type:complete
MKFTWQQYGISISIDSDNNVTYEHDKFAEFDAWLDKITSENGTTEYVVGELPDEAYDEQIKQYEENELNKYY